MAVWWSASSPGAQDGRRRQEQFVSDPENGKPQVVVRRRRTRRHRRNRFIRRLLATLFFTVLIASVSTLALMYFSPSLFRASQATPHILPPPEPSREGTVSEIARAQSTRPVYPYSVVPGGVEDANELKWVAEHDPIVAAHYAGFDYARAQVVRLTLARTVYVSYRIGNRIYWSRRRITLHKGEKLLTDGRMTARTRCANRVEEAPQQQASPGEPPVEKFEEPVRAGEGTAVQSPPVAFQSALLNRPQVPGLGPAGPLSLYDPFTPGSFVPIAAPPLPSGGLCEPVKKKKGDDFSLEGDAKDKKKKIGACGEGALATPEPGTWMLFISGLGLIYWQSRRKFARG